MTDEELLDISLKRSDDRDDAIIFCQELIVEIEELRRKISEITIERDEFKKLSEIREKKCFLLQDEFLIWKEKATVFKRLLMKYAILPEKNKPQ